MTVFADGVIVRTVSDSRLCSKAPGHSVITHCFTVVNKKNVLVTVLFTLTKTIGFLLKSVCY